MKKVLYFLLITFSFQQIVAQESELLMETELVTTSDAIAPKFNGGGIDKFYEFIKQEFDLKTIKKEGTIKSSFEVNENGDLKKIKIIEYSNVEAATEMIRVLNKSPKWESATRAGKPFATTIVLPIKYFLKQEKVITNQPIAPKDKIEYLPYNFAELETRPEFIGGMSAFYEFIGKNYNVPNVSGLQGKVLVQFVVEKDGSLADFNIIKDLGYGTGAEAIRVLNLSPKWQPGEQNGKKVRCVFQLPITITAQK